MKSNLFSHPIYLFLIVVFFGLLSASSLLSASDYNPKVKVLLFSDVDTYSSRFMYYGSEITVSTGEQTFLLSRDGSQFSIEVKDGKITLQNGTVRQSVSKLTVSVNDENGLIRLIHPIKGWRYYTGSLEITLNRNRLQIINTTDLENYVAGVVGGEMDFTNSEALKVQSVISRTYALLNILQSKGRDYHLTDTILNQVYPGEIILKPWYREAAESTRGEVLTWNGNIILAAYHSTCGGITTTNESVWIGEAHPYLRSRSDLQSCSISPHAKWDFTFTKAELAAVFNEGSKPDSLIISQFDETGRATEIRIYNNSRFTSMNANTFRLTVNRTFGTRSLKSTFFSIKNDQDSISFRGRGMGHGVGLCQWGALGFAEKGWDYRDILKYYYSRVEIKSIKDLENQDFRLARF